VMSYCAIMLARNDPANIQAKIERASSETSAILDVNA
jgi:hypothetical protein